MQHRVSTAAPAVALLLSLAAFACEDSSTPVQINGMTAPDSIRSTLLTAEPAFVQPDVFTTPSCVSSSAFNLRFSLVVSSGRDLFLRLMTFDFVDRFGRRSRPTNVSIAPFHSHTSSPVAIPSALPIPIPGTLPLAGTRIVSGQSRSLPLSLQFGCGVRASGTLAVAVEAADDAGATDVSHVSVRIGE